MNTHILCLNGILLLFTLNPVSICQMIHVSLTNKRMALTESAYMVLMVTVYALLTLGILAIRPGLLMMKLPTENYWYVIGVIAGPVIIVMEIVVGYFLAILQGIRVKQLSTMKIGGSVSSKLSIIGVGILEELVYRQIWFGILLTAFSLPLFMVIGLSAIFYALNHMTLGWKVFVQKCLSGTVFGLLYAYSGYAIVIPIIAHVIQNGIIVGRGD